MGNSLHNALKAAMQKAGVSLPEGKKPQTQPQKKYANNSARENAGSDNAPKPLPPQAQQQEQTFLDHMKGAGVGAVQFNKPKIPESKPGAQQEISATASPKSPAKRVVIFEHPVAKKEEKSSAPKQLAKKVGTVTAKRQQLTQPKASETANPIKEQRPDSLPPPPVPYTIEIKDNITVNPLLTATPQMGNLLIPKNDGINEQLHTTKVDDEREVVIGLDFGTACVKVVISDKASGKSFAIPFSDDMGLSAYLLPSWVRIGDGGYSLSEQGVPRRNLKLSLIDPACSEDCFADAAAFLALVVRRSRGWFLSQYADSYKKIKIFWKLTLGLPAATYEDKDLVVRFKKLAASAWLIAGLESANIPKEIVKQVCREAHEKDFARFSEKPEISDAAFSVTPELSAQLYGFLTSTKFDKRARNIFMMVDVGAGTVDSSVFYASKGRGNKPQFNFYSNIVEFNGVANLHAERIKWLRQAFRAKDILKQIPLDIDAFETSTDKLNGVPEKIGDYFNGIELSFQSQDADPDHIFYNNRLRRQVIAKTLHGSRKYVTDFDDFAGMPLYLCGGGSRMKFYQQLEQDLLSHKNASWFRFQPKKLEIPEMLIVPGVKKEEFDRLSVAFGLSVLDVGEYLKQQAEPHSRSESHLSPKRCPWCNAVGGCYCG